MWIFKEFNIPNGQKEVIVYIIKNSGIELIAYSILCQVFFIFSVLKYLFASSMLDCELLWKLLSLNENDLYIEVSLIGF